MQRAAVAGTPARDVGWHAEPSAALPGAVAGRPAPDAGVAAHYGDPFREQRALAAGEASVDLSHRGVVRVTGPDRLTWLHSLTTQHVERPAARRADRGAGAVAARPRRARALPGRRRRDDLDPRRAGHRGGAGRLPRVDAVLSAGRGRRPSPTSYAVRAAPPAHARAPDGVAGARRRPTASSCSCRAPTRGLAVRPGRWPACGRTRRCGSPRGRPRLGLRDRPPDHPARGRLARDRRAPGQGLLPRPGDGRPGAQPGPAAAPAGAAAPGRQRRRAARRTATRSLLGRTGRSASSRRRRRHYELGPDRARAWSSGRCRPTRRWSPAASPPPRRSLVAA